MWLLDVCARLLCFGSYRAASIHGPVLHCVLGTPSCRVNARCGHTSCVALYCVWDFLYLLADVHLRSGLQPEPRELEHGDSYGHDFRTLLADLCGHAGLTPLAAPRASSVDVLRLLHVCARLANMLRLIWRCFGALCCMERCLGADVPVGVGLQPEHRRLEHGEGFDDVWGTLRADT